MTELLSTPGFPCQWLEAATLNCTPDNLRELLTDVDSRVTRSRLQYVDLRAQLYRTPRGILESEKAAYFALKRQRARAHHELAALVPLRRTLRVLVQQGAPGRGAPRWPLNWVPVYVLSLFKPGITWQLTGLGRTKTLPYSQSASAVMGELTRTHGMFPLIRDAASPTGELPWANAGTVVARHALYNKLIAGTALLDAERALLERALL